MNWYDPKPLYEWASSPKEIVIIRRRNMAFIDRLIDEQKELAERVEKLDNFINGAKFGDITEHEQGMLVEQLKIMQKYNTILISRLKFYGIKPKK